MKSSELPSPPKRPRSKLSRRKKLQEVLRKTAPQLAQALGGPLAGAAMAAIANTIMGRSDEVDEQQLEQALSHAEPEILVKLRQTDARFAQIYYSAQQHAEQVAMQDRHSARERQIALKDQTPTLLGAGVIIGFFIVLAAMLIGYVPQGAETEFSILLGALSTMTAAVVNYYFGSSAGSREKTHLLRDMRRI
ncbi:MAG: hypothetical protein ACWA5L_05425 [bacterium]